MATGLHKDLPDSELHEPKGAASASSGDVLTSDGSGGSSFQAPAGGPDATAIHKATAGEIAAMTAKTTPVDADILVIEDSASSNAKRKITLGSLPTSPGPARVITVATSGGDYTSVASAVSAASSLSPTSTNPVVIRVYPGTYTEGALTLPDYVSLEGLDARASKIVASTTGSALITAGDSSSVRNLALSGANTSGGRGISISGGDKADVSSVIVSDCTTGLYVEGSGSRCRVTTARLGAALSGETMTTAISVTGAAVVEAENITVHGRSGTRIADGIVCSGAGSLVQIAGYRTDEMTRALYVHTNGEIRIDGAWIESQNYGLHVGANGTLIAEMVYIGTSDTWSAYAPDATSSVVWSGGHVIHEEVYAHPSGDFLAYHLSKTSGDEALKVHAELHVGTEHTPFESCLGGGDSHVRGLAFLTNTNQEAGTWADHSTDIADPSTTTTVFAGTGSGQCAYIGGDVKFPGVKAAISAALVIGTGGIAAEYWDGSSWTAFNSMSTDASAPYESYGWDHMTRVQSDQIRFDWMTLDADWATKSLNGTTKYWVRYRITAAITTSPVASQFKLHTSRWEANGDGFTERFGGSIKSGHLPIQWDDLSGFSPGNATIWFGSGVGITPVDNRFNSGAHDAIGGFIDLIGGVDTSRKITVVVVFLPSGTGAGVVEFDLDYRVTVDGDTLNASQSMDGTIHETVTIPSGSRDKQFTAEISFAIPKAVSGSRVGIALHRDATTGNLDDTYGGNVELVGDPNVSAYFWR